MEGCFESWKSKYSLDLIMARLSKGAEALISIAFLVMCAEKFLRLLRLFFSPSVPGSMPGNVLGARWVVLKSIWQLEMADSPVAV